MSESSSEGITVVTPEVPEPISIGEVRIFPPVQQAETAENNLVEKLEPRLTKIGGITKQLRIPSPEKRRIRIHAPYQRTIGLRTERSEMLRDLKSGKRPLDEISQEAKARDRIAQQYLNQGIVAVHLPELGVQKSRYVELTPPFSDNDHPISNKTVVLIPGISGDIDTVGTLAQEIAVSGYRVVVVGHPESTLGEITEKFAKKATERADSYEPHVTYYRYIIEELTKRYGKLLPWGYSTGAAIIGELLTNPRMQQLIDQAVLQAPAGVTTQSPNELSMGAVGELPYHVTHPQTLGAYSLVLGRKEPQSEEQERLKAQVFKKMQKRAALQQRYMKNMAVARGGKIVLALAGDDHVTKSDRILDEEIQQPQVNIVHFPRETHTSFITRPKETVKQVLQTLSAHISEMPTAA